MQQVTQKTEQCEGAYLVTPQLAAQAVKCKVQRSPADCYYATSCEIATSAAASVPSCRGRRALISTGLQELIMAHVVIYPISNNVRSTSISYQHRGRSEGWQFVQPDSLPPFPARVWPHENVGGGKGWEYSLSVLAFQSGEVYIVGRQKGAPLSTLQARECSKAC